MDLTVFMSDVNQANERLIYHQSKQRFQAGSRLFSSARVQEVRTSVSVLRKQRRCFMDAYKYINMSF